MNFFNRSRAFLPLFFFATLGWALHRCRGQYDGRALWAIIGTFLAAQLGFWAKPEGLLERGKTTYTWIAALSIVFLFASLSSMYKNPLVIYASDPENLELSKLSLIAAAIFAMALVLRMSPWGHAKMKFSIAWCGIPIALSLVAAKFFAMWSSPHPFIDVFTVPTQAADYFLSGKNPYTQVYTDIYKGFYHYPPAFDYWPGDLYIESFFRGVTGDVRTSLIFSDLGTAFCAHRILVKFKQRELSWIIPLTWLAFPCSLFVLEQAWIDPILLFFGALFTLFAVDRRWLSAGLALGAFCTIKQYAIFFAVLAFFLSLKDAFPKRAALRLVGGAVASFSVILLPFALWDWNAFYERTIQLILRQEMRTDALTLTAWFHYLNLPPITSGISSTAYLLATVFGCIAILRTKENALHAFFCAVTLTYGVVFLLGKQAFCNYYYLLAGFVLLQVVSGLGYRHAER